MRLRVTSTVLLLLTACGDGVDEGDGAGAGRLEESVEQSALSRSCADGPKVRGIDVSYYQGNIDWDRVSSDGVRFAIIRVSDGLAHVDSQFARNWREAKRATVRRGAYQYFRPNLDPVAQAELLLSRMGPLEPGDLPPTIDVEATGGLSPSAVAARVRTWIEHVEGRLGVTPIIYTGPYFWQDSVGGPSFAARHPLWIAHYTTQCPLTPGPWSRWSFHQYTDSGRVAGIVGSVDTNVFNGTEAQLAALGVGGVVSPPPAPPPSGCEAIGPGGRVLEEDDACVELGGPTDYLRSESGGSDGSHVWTGTTDHATPTNYATYTLSVVQGGRYSLRAYVEGDANGSREARYRIRHAGGVDDVYADQSSARGAFELGTFELAAGAAYELRIDDNTGEPSSRRLRFDAISIGSPDPTACRTIALKAGTRALNVRPRPNTGRAPLTELVPGVTAVRLADVPGAAVSGNTRWQRVRIGQTVGYVSSEFTSCVN